MAVTVVPQAFTVEGISFSAEDVLELKTLFQSLDMILLPKSDIRTNSSLQKAVQAGVALCNLVDTTSDQAILNLSQDGRILLGKI
jgi:hypothetical protein